MRFSLNELQKYLASSLPPVEKIAKELTEKAFEVESIERADGDIFMEVKVLPDRPDCKEPLGLAREISAIFDLEIAGDYIKTDKYSSNKVIQFTLEDINSIIGLQLGKEKIQTFLTQLRADVEEIDGQFKVQIPDDRIDLNIVEDIADEIARLYGINEIPSIKLPNYLNDLEVKGNKVFELSNSIRNYLLDIGYVEVYGYTLTSSGDVEVEKPLAEDKAFLRTNLTDGLKEKLDMNLRNILFDNEPVKLFEIGTVFVNDEERVRLAVAIGFKDKKYKKESLPVEIRDLEEKVIDLGYGEMIEISIDEVSRIAGPYSDEDPPHIKEQIIYEPFSLFPRIIRDIAVWVDSDISPEEVSKTIIENADELLSDGPILFDDYKKDDKVSYAFRFAFQAKDRTLTDDEIGQIMEKIEDSLKKKGWIIR